MNISNNQTAADVQYEIKTELPEASWKLSENLQMIHALLQQECTALGVAVPACIQENQIRILPKHEYEKKWAEFPKSIGIAYLDNGHFIDIKDERDDFKYLEHAIIWNAEYALERLASGSEDSDSSDDALCKEAWDEAEALYGSCPEGSEDEFFTEHVDQILKEKYKDRDEYYKMVIAETPKKIDRIHREMQRKVLLHESLHVASHVNQKFTDTMSETWLSIRVGYAIHRPEPRQKIFESLNEAVTEKLTRELLHEMKDATQVLQECIETYNDDEWSSDLQINEVAEKLLPPSYKKDIQLLEALIEKIAHTRNVPKQDIWSKIKKGYFSGEMLHLREIERVLEPGALRLYASCSADSNDSDAFLRYLNATSKAEKNQLFQQMLARLPEWEQKKIRHARKNVDAKQLSE